MNICLLVKDFAAGDKFSKDGMPIKSGAEFHAENHAKQLMKLGHRLTIFTKKRLLSTASRENIDGIDLVRLHGGFRWLEIWIRLLTTHRDIDAFYIIGRPSFAVWAIKFAKMFHKPVTLALTNNDEVFADENWRNRIFQTCDHFVATSQEIGGKMHDIGKIDNNRISIIPHGVDVHRFAFSNEENRRKLKREFKLDPDTKILLFLARINIHKGIDTLQEVWKKLHPMFPDAKLLIVGGGLNTLIEQLKNLSNELDNSIFLTGEIEDPSRFYQMGDIYIFPSRGEALPTSLIEAMSSGLPSVVSDIGGNEDVIFDYEDGFRVPTEDVDAYVSRISELFSDDKLRLKLGENAAKIVREKCAYEKVIPKLEAVITDESFTRS